MKVDERLLSKNSMPKLLTPSKFWAGWWKGLVILKILRLANFRTTFFQCPGMFDHAHGHADFINFKYHDQFVALMVYPAISLTKSNWAHYSRMRMLPNIAFDIETWCLQDVSHSISFRKIILPNSSQKQNTLFWPFCLNLGKSLISSKHQIL